MPHPPCFPRIVSLLVGAAALFGCALDTGGGSPETTQSGASNLTQVTGAPAASAQLVVQGGGAAPPFDFGGVVAGSTAVRLFTVTNTGTAASGPLSTVAVSGASAFSAVTGPTPCLGVKLAPQKKCDVVVAYAPAAVGAADAATLTVSDGAAKVTAALNGVGIGMGVDYVVSPGPANLALGLGQSAHLTFTVTNAGTAPGPAITVVGADGDGSYAWFHLANDGCSKNPGLGVLATCSFDVDVAVPASPAQQTGTYNLTIAGAGAVAPGNATAVYSKVVVTTPPAVAYVLSPAPVSVTLAPGASGHVTFTVTNQGWHVGPSINGVGLDGTSWYSKKNDACTGSPGLAAGATCTFDVDIAVPAAAAAQPSVVDVVVNAGGALDPEGDNYLFTQARVTVP